jgi:hypothetical protein
MSLDRNAILDALYALAKTAGAATVAGGVFNYAGKRLKHWKDVVAQPALFVCPADDDYLPRDPQRTRAKVLLEFELFIYCRAPNGEESPHTVLNPLIKALEDVLTPGPVVNVQTLGLAPVVQHCWIEGQLKKGYDVNTGQLVAVVPVKVLAIS